EAGTLSFVQRASVALERERKQLRQGGGSKPPFPGAKAPSDNTGRDRLVSCLPSTVAAFCLSPPPLPHRWWPASASATATRKPERARRCPRCRSTPTSKSG